MAVAVHDKPPRSLPVPNKYVPASDNFITHLSRNCGPVFELVNAIIANVSQKHTAVT